MGFSIFPPQAEVFILGTDDDEEAGAAEEPAAPDTTYLRLEQMQTRRQIVGVVQRLPSSERRIVLGHYFHLQPFEEIAHDMGLTKGRVSQLHHAALARMRAWGCVNELPQPG